MSIEGGENKLLLLLCFYSCFTIFFSDDDLYLYISIFGTAPCILLLNSDLLTAKNCSFYFSSQSIQSRKTAIYNSSLNHTYFQVKLEHEQTEKYQKREIES